MKIAFVIGAGASSDLSPSLPIGSKLAEKIEQLLDNDLESGSNGPISNTFMRMQDGFGTQQAAAMQRIRNSILSTDSIDDFLSEWRDVPYIEQAAKACIAHLILEAEQNSALYFRDSTDGERVRHLRQFNSTWLGMIGRMSNPQSQRRNVQEVYGGISFVVFNYDRMIEQYLIAYFEHVTAHPEPAAKRLVRIIPIIHAYGCLGGITEETVQVPFGASGYPVALAAQGIRTYNEDHPSEDIVQIRKTITSADKVVFLGCAYHTQNIELLFAESPHRDDLQIFGTSYQMAPRRREAAIQTLSKYGSVMTLDQMQCSEFIAKYAEQIF
jgi:hypothetical protein